MQYQVVQLKIVAFWNLLTFIVEYGDENAFPNLRIALQIMLTKAISIVNWEKLILPYLRASMSQDILCGLALMIV